MEQASARRGKTLWKRRVVLIIMLLVLLVTVILFYDSNTRIAVDEYELIYSGLPEAFDGFRIVVLSDLHGAEFGKDNERLLAIVRDAEPDVIALTGDFIDKYSKPQLLRQLEITVSLAAALMESAPVYFVTGNHDWDSGEVRLLISSLEEHGVTVLRNQYVLLESDAQRIVLAGTDDPNGPADMVRPVDFIKRIRDEQGDAFIVLLEHRNYNLSLYSTLGVDLVLSGHGHGGIVRLPFTDGLLGTRRDLFPSHTSGVYTEGDTNMVVSRGLDGAFPWVRFLNNPHVPVVVLGNSMSTG